MSVKEYESRLRYFMIEVPSVISDVNGIKIFGKTIKSLLFSTDVALIRNTDADAVMAVYPFTTQPVINRSIIEASDIPVFCGLGGAYMSDPRMDQLAIDAEICGSFGLIFDAQVDSASLARIKKLVDIPIIATVVSKNEDVDRKLECGADMLNISGAADTCDIIETIRAKYPYVPIIATGGPTDESIKATIASGADAITFTPPTNAEIFKKQMVVYRSTLENQQQS